MTRKSIVLNTLGVSAMMKARPPTPTLLIGRSINLNEQFDRTGSVIIKLPLTTIGQGCWGLWLRE